MNQIVKKVMLLLVVASGVSSQAVAVPSFVKKTGTVIALPFRMIDKAQRSFFSTKTSKNKALLLAAFVVGDTFLGEGHFVGNPFAAIGNLAGDCDLVKVKRVWNNDMRCYEEKPFFCKEGFFRLAVWTGIFLTAINNDRNARDAKAADDAKKASQAVVPASVVA